MVSLIVVALIALAFTLGYAVGNRGDSASAERGHVVVVPDVTGMPLAEAVIKLGSAGFAGLPSPGDPVTPSIAVWAQEPPGGIRVESGAVVGLRTGIRPGS